MRPSFIASAFSGTLIFISLILFIINFKEIKNDSFKIILLITLLGIGFGIHGINHVYEEIYFDFNPFIGKWKVNNDPQKS
jgi:hypothetical protein